MQKRRFLMFLLRVYTNLSEWLVNIRKHVIISVNDIFSASPPSSIEFEYVIDHTRESLEISWDSFSL